MLSTHHQADNNLAPACSGGERSGGISYCTQGSMKAWGKRPKSKTTPLTQKVCDGGWHGMAWYDGLLEG